VHPHFCIPLSFCKEFATTVPCTPSNGRNVTRFKLVPHGKCTIVTVLSEYSGTIPFPKSGRVPVLYLQQEGGMIAPSTPLNLEIRFQSHPTPDSKRQLLRLLCRHESNLIPHDSSDKVMSIRTDERAPPCLSRAIRHTTQFGQGGTILTSDRQATRLPSHHRMVLRL
jgi:hypothetical protein